MAYIRKPIMARTGEEVIGRRCQVHGVAPRGAGDERWQVQQKGINPRARMANTRGGGSVRGEGGKYMLYRHATYSKASSSVSMGEGGAQRVQHVP